MPTSNIENTNPTPRDPTPKEKRVALIKKLQEERDNSLVISFITGTRKSLDFPIAMDSIRKFFEHLNSISHREPKPKVDLFIHSNGGEGIVPWKLVTLIREYSSEFNVLVPHRAFSAATLIALGADNIIMHPMGMLGPTDPTVTNPFNPQNPLNPKQLLGISVEDVSAYINLIKEDFGITHEDELVQAVNILAQKVHPLALGNVKRFHSQSRMLAKKILLLHMEDAEEHKIDKIVDDLTSKLFFHGHPINRKEAKETLNLKIKYPKKEEEDLIWKLYLEYEKEMKLDEEFRFTDEFLREKPNLQQGQSETINLEKVKGVYVESENRTDVYTVNFKVWGTKTPQGVVNTQLLIERQGWEQE
jgi:hypothetical protein